MKIRIASHRGDHQATIENETVQKALFDKLTGKTSKPLSSDVKESIPGTFEELTALFRRGKMGYTAFSKDSEMVIDFDPSAKEIAFFPPIQGG